MTEPTPQGPPQDDPILDRAKQLRAAGATIDEVKQYLSSKGYETGEPEERPGAFSRGMSALGAGIAHAFEHPIDTAESMITTPIKSAFNTVVAPGVGEARPDARLSKGGNSSGRAIDTTPYDAAHGAVTPAERTAAGVQTITNLVTPRAFGPLKSLAAKAVGSKVGSLAALGVTGAAEGAAYSPDDPLAGAWAGGVMTPLTGGALAATLKGSGKLTDLVSKARRIKAAPAIDQTAFAVDDAIADATSKNYGKVREDVAASSGTSPGIQKVLKRPVTAEYLDRVQKGVDDPMRDADALQEIYKSMSKDRRGYKDTQERLGYDRDRQATIEQLGRELKVIREAMSSHSQKPPLTLDVAPEVYETAPKVERGHEPLSGPLSRGRPAKVLPGHEPVSGPVRAGLLADVTQAPSDPTLRQALRDFPDPSLPPQMKGPSGPAFQLRGQGEQVVSPEVPAKPAFQLKGTADKVTPGVRIETPEMRVQTAPAEDVPPVAPTFPHAVGEKKRMETTRELSERVGDLTSTVMRGKSVGSKKGKLLKDSPEALRRLIAGKNGAGGLTPEQAKEVLPWALGRAKEGMQLKPQQTLWKSITGLAQPAQTVHRVSPFIDLLNQQAGNATRTPVDVNSILRAMGILNVPVSTP